MQAILMKDVEGLGAAGTVVNVARGYMRNYLEPRKLAELATPTKIAQVAEREAQRRNSAAKATAASVELQDLLARTILTLKAKSGADGRLFGSITSGDISDAIFEARGIRIDRREISVDPPIRATGTYSVPVHIGPGIVAEVKTLVSPIHDE